MCVAISTLARGGSYSNENWQKNNREKAFCFYCWNEYKQRHVWIRIAHDQVKTWFTHRVHIKGVERADGSVEKERERLQRQWRWQIKIYSALRALAQQNNLFDDIICRSYYCVYFSVVSLGCYYFVVHFASAVRKRHTQGAKILKRICFLMQQQQNELFAKFH